MVIYVSQGHDVRSPHFVVQQQSMRRVLFVISCTPNIGFNPRKKLIVYFISGQYPFRPTYITSQESVGIFLIRRWDNIVLQACRGREYWQAYMRPKYIRNARRYSLNSVTLEDQDGCGMLTGHQPLGREQVPQNAQIFSQKTHGHVLAFNPLRQQRASRGHLSTLSNSEQSDPESQSWRCLSVAVASEGDYLSSSLTSDRGKLRTPSSWRVPSPSP